MADGVWSDAENDLIVADYFAMLGEDIALRPYNKSEHRRLLRAALNDRSDGSVEFKHQNISAVLVNMGLPYVDGYKPRGNFQAILATGVEDYTNTHQDFFDKLADAKMLNPTEIPALAEVNTGDLFVPPPERITVPDEASQPWLSRRGRKIDFARRDAENRRMGRLGERFVVEVEKRRLLQARRDDLAKKVEWVADTCGDGLGFDVLSFNEADDAERYVEVKTTGLGKFFPFYVTRNEVRFSEDQPDRYHLYRVFDFSRTARLYVLPGALSRVCRLDPVQYRASI